MSGLPYFWATWLREALEADPFVKERLVVVQGWESRGRTPVTFSFNPSGVLEHHTACFARRGHDPQSCLNAILSGRTGAPGPISQLFGTWTPLGVKWDGSNVDPRIALVAAGRSNHAGAGQYPWGAPEGNGSSIGIEWCGPPETVLWPDEVIELRARVTAAILKNRGWGVQQVTTHWEYARPKGRKIDPSGPWSGQAGLNWNSPWSPNLWREQVRHVLEDMSVLPQQQTYTVQAGDSWWGIAVKVYGDGSKWNILASANGGTARVLHPGDVLTVPALEPGGGGGVTPPPPPPPPPTDWTEDIVNSLPAVGPGSSGTDVKRVQALLVANGYNPGNIDGMYTKPDGPTGRVVRAFQANKNVQGGVDGKVGRYTWAALLGV